MQTGSKVMLYYFMLTYGIQSVCAAVFTPLFFQDYKGYSDGIVWKLSLMALVGSAIFIGQSLIRQRAHSPKRVVPGGPGLASLVNSVRVIAALTFIGLSIPFGIEYGFSFFHSGRYLSDLPLWVIVLQAMKSLARLDLAYCTIKVMRGEKLSNVDLLTTSSYTLGGIISLAGAIDVVYLVLGFLLLIGRGQLVMRAFTASAPTPRKKKNKRRWVVYLLLAASLPGVAVIGFANKIGFERTYDIVADPGLLVDDFVAPLMLRVSSSHGSFMANVRLPLSIPEQVESISYPVRNMLWRSCILFKGQNCPNRADITHLARLNYIRTFWDQSPLKAGATPGLLASALYFPFLPFSVLLFSMYCSLFTGAIDRALGPRKMPLIGILTLLLFLFPVFENPIDLLVIFDPAAVYTLGMLFVIRSFRNNLVSVAPPSPTGFPSRGNGKHALALGVQRPVGYHARS